MPTPTQSDRILQEWFPVCPVDQLATGSCFGFELPGDRFLLAVGIDGRVPRLATPVRTGGRGSHWVVSSMTR